MIAKTVFPNKEIFVQVLSERSLRFNRALITEDWTDELSISIAKAVIEVLFLLKHYRFVFFVTLALTVPFCYHLNFFLVCQLKIFNI